MALPSLIEVPKAETAERVHQACRLTLGELVLVTWRFEVEKLEMLNEFDIFWF